MASRRAEALSVHCKIERSRGAVADEFWVRDIYAVHPLAGGVALQETAEALYVRKFGHG